ncbi:ATP-binding protein [Geodermatophilus sp. SYSU D01036]
MIPEAAQVYWADGGGSRAVFDSLREILVELRAAVLSERAIALYQPTGTAGSDFFVLSDSCSAGLEPAIANEPLRLNQSLDTLAPVSVSGVAARSRLRPFGLHLASALAMPWRDPFGRGVVLVGIEVDGRECQSLQRLSGVADLPRLTRTLGESRLNGTLHIQRQLSSALRSVLAADTSGAGPMGRLRSLVDTARVLLRSDAAYLALPEQEPSGTHYYFASFSQVYTPDFRHLRMEFGQGLGGLARRTGRVVTSIDYARDERLLEAPVSETLDEGVLSAVAAPLTRSGSGVDGVLYVGNRTPRPYSETDERLLGEYAEYVSLLMNTSEFKESAQSARLGRLREDFAHAIHDSVVRRLVEIGFTAEQAAASAEDGAAAASVEAIRQAAADALQTLRAELSELVPRGPAQMSVSQVLDSITSVRARPGVSRTVLVIGPMTETPLPSHVAEAVVQVGAEALTNSLKHSGCTMQTISIDSSATGVTLRVTDDGRGSPLVDLDPAQLSSMGHLGVTSMRRRAARIGASLTIDSSIDEGTRVCLDVPRTW